MFSVGCTVISAGSGHNLMNSSERCEYGLGKRIKMNFVSHLYLFCLKESQFSRVDLSGMAVSVLVKLCWFKKCPGDINWTLVMLGRHLWAQTKTLSLEYPQITGFLRCSGISCLLSGKSVWVWNFDSLLERSWS